MNRYFCGFLILKVFMNPVAAFLSPADQTLEKAAETRNAELEVYLKYQSLESDYLVFYDLEGSTLLLRYRVDRWDYDNDVLRDSLVQGVTYRVRVKNLKKLAEGEIPAGVRGSGLPQVPQSTKPGGQTRKIRRLRELYAGEMINVSEAALRDLRY